MGAQSGDTGMVTTHVKRRVRSASRLLACAVFVVSLCGCGKEESRVGTDGRTKIRVGYIGLTCEAPIFTAVEKGFFKEEGLDVELVRCEWATYKDALALGR